MEGMMLFSLGQSSDCFAILRNLLEKHYPFPAGVLRTLRKIKPSEGSPQHASSTYIFIFTWTFTWN